MFALALVNVDADPASAGPADVIDDTATRRPASRPTPTADRRPRSGPVASTLTNKTTKRPCSSFAVCDDLERFLSRPPASVPPCVFLSTQCRWNPPPAKMGTPGGRLHKA